ncbi:MAG: nuclear transport factor 2 family protein [Erythrobacter sp.]
MSKTTANAFEAIDNTRVEAALNEWQRIFKQLDWENLPGLLADHVTYSNPGDATPLRGKEAVVDSLRLSFSIFEGFEYARHFNGEEGHVLEFRGSVGEVAFTGIDIIRFDAAGKITDLVVMIRPIAAVMKLGEEAARRMAISNHAAQE